MNRYKFDEKNHLHTLDGKPLIGTSTVGSVVAKPLTWWAAGKALEELGWTNPKLVKSADRLAAAKKSLNSLSMFHLADDIDGFLALLDRCYRAHDTFKNKAADTGTDMHAELEMYVKRCIRNESAGQPMHEDIDVPYAVAVFSKWARQNVLRFLWSEAHCYSEKLWTGGITDCGAKLKNGNVAIIDFKSSKEAYMSQFWQVAGYDIEISENGGFDKDGNKLFEPMKIDCHIVFPFGAVEPTAQVRYDVESDREAFEAEVVLYKKLNQN